MPAWRRADHSDLGDGTDGGWQQGLSQANTMVRGYYDTATNLMFAIGAILGIVGAIRVFSMWIRGDERMGHTAAMWFGACIFLVVVATVIKSFFGL